MFQIHKNEPKYFTLAKAKVKQPKIKSAWEDNHISAIREKLRGDILLEEQNLLCAYCQKEIDSHKDFSNIDHFKTRNLFPELTLEYHNLLVSCNTKNRCSSSKDSKKSILKTREDYDNIVNPTSENPDDYFDYLPTGEIVAKNKKAKFTIELFNLEDKSLSQCRLQVAKSLIDIDLSIEDICDIFPDYHNFIKIIYPKLKEL